MTEPVVVGVDGSPASANAARHAARSATCRNAPLVLVHGYLHAFAYGVPINPYALQLPPPSEAADAMLQEMAAAVRQQWPDLAVTVRHHASGPAAALIDESQRAQLVVVGSRGHGGFPALLLGSVSSQVIAHADCPVLVIRPPDAPADLPGPVVVGVDGSPGAAEALAVAADEADRRHATLAVTHVWSVSDSGIRHPTYADLEATARARAEAVLAESVADVRRRHPEVTVEERLVHELSPEVAMVEASRQAAVLVVGSRGRGGFSGLLLGSVSQALVHHAHCPVLVTHPRQR